MVTAMERSTSKKRNFQAHLVAVPGLALAALLSLPVQSQELSAADIQALVDQVKQEVIEELRGSDLLREEIDAGIKAYIAEQKAAREEEAKARERLAAEKAKAVRRPAAGRDHFYGAPDAPLTLIEYSDFECPFCKRFHPTAKQLVDQSNGQVNWVYRHYPLPFHNPGAQKQAEASECAYEQGGDEAFWKYTDALYARTKSGGKGFALDKLTPLAEELGLDGKAFESCLSSDKYAGRVKEDLEEGASVGITGTPGNILLNNASGEVSLISGAKPLPALEQEVEKLLNPPSESSPPAKEDDADNADKG